MLGEREEFPNCIFIFILNNTFSSQVFLFSYLCKLYFYQNWKIFIHTSKETRKYFLLLKFHVFLFLACTVIASFICLLFLGT